MKKLVSILLIALLVFTLCSCDVNSGEDSADLCYVRFMTNCSASEVELSSQYKAIGTDVMFDSATVQSGSKLQQPKEVPVRTGYDFVGWSVDKDGNTMWQFDNDMVTTNLTLYAQWQRVANADEDDFVEVELSFVEDIDDSVNGLQLNGVLNSPVNGNNVNLTTIGIRLLEEHQNNVKEYLNYKINSNSSIVSATYSSGTITIDYLNNGVSNTLTVSVSDVTAQLKVTSSSYYEAKAVKYEANTTIDPYNIVMGGSSSMENWSTSVSDMAPLTTVNVGIGGTTVEQWNDCLAERLIYPFSPRAVVLYVGINNIINAGKTGTETGNALLTLFDNIHTHLPNTTVYYILINLVPGYMKYSGSIGTANQMVKDFAEGKDWMQLIDAGKDLVKESGTPNAAYFLTDGLHMSYCGYVIWGGEVKNAVIAHEKELYK